MNKNLDIITIGECLLELSTKNRFEETKEFNFSFGGDVVTSTISAAKVGAKVGFLTAIGNDLFKNYLLENLNNYSIDLSHAKFCNEKNGLYFTGLKKELATYRRRVAGNLLNLDNYNEAYIDSTKILYSTGITQSLSQDTTQLIKKSFEYAKNNDVLTAYDPNHTSAFMTAYDTKEYLEDLVQHIDIIFLSHKNDGEVLFGLSSVEKMINYFVDNGVKIIIIKSHSDNGYHVYNNGKVEFLAFCNETQAQYTRGTGDIFNGCFLAAYTKGYTPFEATQFALKQVAGYMTSGNLQNITTFEGVKNL